ncbi:HEAT repeat domain-containing protein [Halococcus saccharolyticus]|uniref:HEAT repeat protein n=1 Tax=Halococcus saccharolyticus DSM 5350 TaxID=1227455 RepID=M0MCD4_9EURY|nr:HEAT repeat domain-containing protein [Halococcus saccharolyticus]EMA43411.1 hypothetical protein C449_15592 [Halococcus saccharolyticus DSM 5350]
MGDAGPDSSLQAAVDEALERSDGTEVAALVETLPSASVETRKACLRSLKAAVTDDPAPVEPALPACEALLEDAERSVRLTTTKLFVAVAEAVPEAVVPMVPALADRLADEEEFYYVRARSAEALGYAALEHPDIVVSPELLADLRIGLSFDESEVKEKLAKTLEHVALGDPERLRHHVPALADHLDDENVLVRYHLSTALTVVGCEHPRRLAEASDALGARLADENAHVQGRAAEALGLLTHSEADVSLSEPLAELGDDGEPFVAKRVRFALTLNGPDNGNEQPETDNGIGSIDAIRETTDEAVSEITAPDGDGCPHCGLTLPEGGPPMCPQCGAPY